GADGAAATIHGFQSQGGNGRPHVSVVLGLPFCLAFQLTTEGCLSTLPRFQSQGGRCSDPAFPKSGEQLSSPERKRGEPSMSLTRRLLGRAAAVAALGATVLALPALANAAPTPVKAFYMYGTTLSGLQTNAY